MSTRRRPSANVLALVALAVLVAAVLLLQRPWASGDDRAVVLPDDPAVAVRAQLAAVSDALATGSSDDVAAAVGEGTAAQELADDLTTSLEATGVSGVELRLTNLAAAPDGPDGTYAATTKVTWQRDEGSVLGAGEVRSTVELRLRPRDADGFDLVGADAAPGVPLPVWLAGEVSVSAVDGATVVRVDGGSIEGLDAMAAAARTQVATVLGDSPLSPGPVDPRILLLDPPSGDRAAALLGRPAAEVEGIAGVSTRLDGAPAVVLNPDEFDTMDARARQVVITHEAVHLVTDAIASPLETWVVEGFADWVALRDDSAPLTVSAGQILAQVAQDGPPAALPTAADFAGDQLGATYEGAWLVFQVLAEQTSAAAVLSFYGDVLAGVAVPEALARIGTDVPTLTAQWQDYLTYNASTMS